MAPYSFITTYIIFLIISFAFYVTSFTIRNDSEHHDHSESSSSRLFIPSDYEMIKELGSGHYARVYKATEKSSGRTVAIKKMTVRNNTEEMDQDETDWMERLHYSVSEWIMSTEYYTRIGQNNIRHLICPYEKYSYDGEFAWMVLPYISDAYSLDKICFNSWAVLLQWMQDFISLVMELQANRLCHGDISQSNILVSVGEGNWYLIDYGLSQVIGQGDPYFIFTDACDDDLDATKLFEALLVSHSTPRCSLESATAEHRTLLLNWLRALRKYNDRPGRLLRLSQALTSLANDQK